MSTSKLFSYSILLAIALLLPINSFAYEYDKREGKWVVRAKIGGLLADSKDTGYVGDTSVGQVSSENFFGNNYYAELEGDYFLFDRLSLGGFLGYMPQKDSTWSSSYSGSLVEDPGKLTVLPVGAIVKFHIAPYGEIRPYVGAGYYYGFMHSTYSYLEHDESTSGPVFAGGLDWWFDRDWALNIEAKQFMMTFDVDSSKLTGISGFKVESEANPLALTVGITHRF